ncbi:hypothetical protein [Hyphobacterium indicum]|uniref:hypothetical protein n=1 Tax=Hyphobacterium indicum TaxID=2162714 RepID=UPI000D650B62|nr:hypothetical protein [Hyphobacterium indicum]
MILDNLSRAFKTQNWLAAGVEFVIVIAGVVIGFQINAWNEGRQADARASVLLARLGEEVAAALDEKERDLERLIERHDALSQFNEVVAPDAVEAGSEALCRLIDQSHIYLWQRVRMPVLAEMTATGSLDLISSADVRNAVIALDADLTGASDRIEIIRSVENIVRLRFPELLEVRPAAPGNARPNEWPVTCDWAQMRANPAVFNTIANNYDRQGAMLHLLRFEIGALRRLLEAIESDREGAAR